MERTRFHSSDIRALLVSHGHADHCGGTRAIQNLTNATVYMSRDDLCLIHEPSSQNIADKRLTPHFEPNRFYNDNNAINIGRFSIKACLTRGHTPGTTCLTPGFTSNIFKKLFNGVRRYPGNGVNFLRSYTDIYKAGFEKYTGYVAGGFEADGSDRYSRTWYVYQPKSVKPNKPAPVVFVFHGAGGSGDEIADRSGWKKVADKYGLILVCPTGSHTNTPRSVSNMVTNEYMRAMWNTGAATAVRPSDLKFVEYLHGWVQQNYNVDATRVYAGGQSSGGSMSWACTLKLPKMFAGTSPVSSGMGSTTEADTSSIVPIIHFIGEKDPSFTTGFSSSSGKNMINYWVDRYLTVEKYSTYKYLLEGQQCTFKSGNFNIYVFNTKAGVPLLRAVEVTTSVHAIWPSECFAAWEEFFTYFTKAADGSLYYKGNLVVIE